MVGSLQEEAKKLVLGRKSGDSLRDETLQQTLIITETYDVKQINNSESAEDVRESAELSAGAEVIRTKTKRAKKA